MPEIIDTSEFDAVMDNALGNRGEDAEAQDDTLSIIETRNRALIDEIHALGGQIPPVLLQQVQIDMLTDLLWPQGSPTRKLHDLMLEDRLTGVLEQLKQATIRGRLTEGI
jgi:hypothetical protein